MIKKIFKLLLLMVFVVLGAFAWWIQPDHVANEVIFTGGNIITVNDAAPTAQAVLVQDGVIAAVGDLADIQAKAGDADTIDLDGKTMVPGLIEPHTHAVASAMLGAVVDISGFTHRSRAAVMAALDKAVKEEGVSPWVVAFGWDPVVVDDLTPPTLAELDALSPDRPLVILTQMMHEAYINSAAMDAAGMTRDTPDPNHGTFRRDENGELTGVINEVGAVNYVFAAMPATPDIAIELLTSLQMQKYARAGYTTVSVVGVTGSTRDDMGMLSRLAHRSSQPVRLCAYEKVASGKVPSPGGDKQFQMRGMKFWLDGSPYAGGAAWAEPYENSTLMQDRLGLPKDHMAPLNYSDEELNQLVAGFHKAGHQLSFHVQGERAVDQALNAVEAALTVHPRADHRHRMEHAALITKKQLERAHGLGMTVSFFIDHIYYYGDKLPVIIGEERLKRYMPMKTAEDTGMKFSLHGDHPATPIGPFRSYGSATTRTSFVSGRLVGEGEKLSRLSALKAMTIHAAWQLGMEQDIGSIEVGKHADFTILSANLFDVADDQLRSVTALATWRDGQPVDTRPMNWDHIQLGAKAVWAVVTQ